MMMMQNDIGFLLRDAMQKHGLYRRAVSVCPSVRLTRRPCSDFMDMLQRLIGCRIIIIILSKRINKSSKTIFTAG